MKRHDLDVVSLISGLLFAGLGLVFALHALGAFSLDVRAVPAVVLIVLGVAGISAAVTATSDSTPEAADAADSPPAGSASETAPQP